MFDVPALRSRLRTTWGAGDVSPSAVSAAAAFAAELAGRAYLRDDAGGRRQAESILYFLGIDSAFAPPADPVAAAIWSILMQAKLAGLRAEYRADVDAALAELDADGIGAALQAAAARWGAHRHPLLDDLEASGDLDAYRVWAKNWFGSCYGFARQLTSLLQRCSGQAKRTVLENLSDELQGVDHDTLRVRFYGSLGLSHACEQAIEDPDWVLASTELLNLRTGVCVLRDPMPALGCFYGVEANWPPECRRHHAIHVRRGVDEHIIEYWTEHAFADEQHSSGWLDAVTALCQTREQRAAAVEGAVIQLRLRWRMYDAIRARIAARA